MDRTWEIALAGLLHDVGKPFQRTTLERATEKNLHEFVPLMRPVRIDRLIIMLLTRRNSSRSIYPGCWSRDKGIQILWFGQPDTINQARI